MSLSQSNIYEFLKTNQTDILITKDDKDSFYANHVASFLGFNTFVLPDFRANYMDDLRVYTKELHDILISLNNFLKCKKSKKLLISPIRTILNNFPKDELFCEFKLEFADTIKLDEFKKMLFCWGYNFVDIVESRGEVSFRGDIIDLFAINAKKPYRISLFDNEIESIREFECEDQKSLKQELDSIIIYPALFGLDEKLHDKLLEKTQNANSDSFIKDIASLGFWLLDELSCSYLDRYKSIFVHDMQDEIDEIFTFKDDESLKKRLLSLPTIQEAIKYKDIQITKLNPFLEYHKDKKIKIIAKNEAIIKQAAIDSNIEIKYIYEDFILNIMSKDELIISLNKPSKQKRRKRSTIVLDDLKVGDYVVHENYGIGIFKGLSSRTILNSTRDFVQISYLGDDRLLIPVENLDMIDRYISDGGNLAIVDKLGKGSFLKLKKKTQEKLFEIAKEIIEVAAQRELIKAPIIRSDFEEIKLFQNDAGFIYTKDQERAICEIFDDLSSEKVMDRLLSGDVGFGKTEVAMNAIFATIKSGYQAAFVVPTTLLSNQHFQTLEQRFKPYNIKVARLDRFVSAKERAKILQELKDGIVDICIGTHSLLGAKFKKLALLVIDEEHKFGVKQKEKLKNFKENLHVLSMSATPIPRSLNMALSSIKQYSILQTPPEDRVDIRTFVKEYNPSLIKEVILRELRRGGQIFYVHNRIASIEDKKEQLLEILPNIKILLLHSKVSSSITEKEMINFENRKYDLLLCTSIVESGVHLPNVNTMIVENADNFGMADLHQLRGRVGRSNKEGFCYFLVKDKNRLTKQSQKRLIALESNSFLGSGSLLAYHDLEIRGGGNLIGKSQSGHIKNIGYSLYLKMLEDSINILLNRVQTKKKSVEIKLSVNAYLSSEYIAEDRLRLELYRRLSRCESVKEVYEIEEEMIDRFGKLDISSKQFLDIIIIKILASQKDIKLISSYQTNITITHEDDKKSYIQAKSKDDDDLIEATLKFVRA